MNTYQNGSLLFNFLVLLCGIGILVLWQILKNVKTLHQERILAAVLLVVIVLALAHLWQFTSPDTRGSEAREAFEFWRLLVTFVCVTCGVPTLVAVVFGYRKK